MGTHFGWHLLNAVVLYLGIRILATRLQFLDRQASASAPPPVTPAA